jgi:hypothetical protein
MSTFQTELVGRMHLGFLGTGNASWSNIQTSLPKQDSSSWFQELLLRLPRAIRDVVSLPHYYAPYRDSINQLCEMIESVQLGDVELDNKAQSQFMEAAYIAGELLLVRPESIPIPQLDVRDDGKIEFEWYDSPRKLVSFTISRDRVIVCTGIRGNQQMGVRDIVSTQWPRGVLSTIRDTLT